MIFLIVAAVTAIGLFAATRYDYLPMIVALLLEAYAQNWIPVVFVLMAIWNFAIGVGSLFRVVDIESEEQLPTYWG